MKQVAPKAHGASGASIPSAGPQADHQSQEEAERQEQMDAILHDLFNREDTVFPEDFPPNNVSEPAVLDCGFGTGAWIERLLALDECNECDVVGVDIFLSDWDGNSDDADDEGPEGVQEFNRKRWNLNAPFAEDRAEDRITPEQFHLINSRLLAEGIDADRWRPYIRELRQALKPGGWLQMVEMSLHFQSWQGLLPDSSYLNRWWERYSRAMVAFGKNPRIGRDLQSLFSPREFAHVRARSCDLPIGTWNPNHVDVGEATLKVVEKMLESYSAWLFLRMERMPLEEYERLISGARYELHDPRYQLYLRVYVVYGQRPALRRSGRRGR